MNRYIAACVAAVTAAFVLSNFPAQATLLADHFGVNPTVTYRNWEYASGQYYTGYQLDASSLTPTQHTSSADYALNDWFGRWTNQVATGVYDYPGTGVRPAGEEPYDVEAYYFDNDSENLYFCAIIGFPSPTTGVFRETRLSGSPVVSHGDFAIDLPHLSGSQTDSWGFSYDYGVDLTDENRPASGNVASFASNTLGTDLYRTTTGWYVGTPNNAVNPITGNQSNALTNFDPSYSGLTSLGSVTTAWYQLQLQSGGVDVQENNWNSYVIEITIPQSMVVGLSDKDLIQFHWLPGCRNDGNNSAAFLTASADFDTPEPGTLALMMTGLPLAAWWKRRRR